MNCVQEPFDFFPKFGKVIDHVFIPPLHTKMGVTNKLVDELESEFKPAKQWSKNLHIVREDYHKQFEGMPRDSNHTFINFSEREVCGDCGWWWEITFMHI